MAGNWITDEATVRRYPSRIDGLFRRQARLTARGLAEQAAYAEDSADNPQLRCLSRPPPAMILCDTTSTTKFLDEQMVE